MEVLGDNTLKTIGQSQNQFGSLAPILYGEDKEAKVRFKAPSFIQAIKPPDNEKK